jgi:hypothetical protein
MSWYWEIALFMQATDNSAATTPPCTGAAIIDKLRSEQQTGFPDVEAVAVELSIVAETAWMGELASWLLYGILPAIGADDFFIRVKKHNEATHFSKVKELSPAFVTSQTASSILFIGKSLHQVRAYGRHPSTPSAYVSQSLSDGELVSAHLQHLTTIALPIAPAQLSRAMSAIRLSLSQNVLRHLLPIEATLRLLSCIKQFLLLGRGEFAVTLINEADNRLIARQQSMGKLLQRDPVRALQGLSIKDTEFQQTLTQTWKVLASQDEAAEDEVLEFAEAYITLSAPTDSDSRPSTSGSVNEVPANLTNVSFNDLLFPSAVSLGMSIAPPLDLIISNKDIETYSTINAYLLSLRRAQVRLSDLWRRTAARRDNAPLRGSTTGAAASPEMRTRSSYRRVATRKVWATCSAAIFLLSEISAYLESEIIRESWDHFEQWAKHPAHDGSLERSQLAKDDNVHEESAQRDPETLATGHRTFLASLTYALLLNDLPYTKELRSLLGNVDQLIAFFNHLLDIQQKLDVENDAGGETGFTTEEESRISLELDRARKRVDSDLKSVINRLRQLDEERIGSGRYLNASAESGFEPWKGGGVDRLLMKLEFGRMTAEEYDLV